MAETLAPVFKNMGEIHVVGLRMSVAPGGGAQSGASPPGALRRLAARLCALIAPGGTAGIPKLWMSLYARIGEIAGVNQDFALGLTLPAADGTVSPQKFDYLAGVPVTGGGASAPAPEGMVRVTLAPRRYAVFTHAIKDKNLSRALPPVFQHIYGTWLPQSGLRRAEGPEFEYYDARFDPKALSGEIDICVPVEEK